MLSRYHCLLFPRSFTLTKGHVNELRDILVHATGGNTTLFSVDDVISSNTDAMTSATTTVPYSVDELQKMLTLINHLTGRISSLYYCNSEMKFLIENVSGDHQGTTCVLSKFAICEGLIVTHYAGSR